MKGWFNKHTYGLNVEEHCLGLWHTEEGLGHYVQDVRVYTFLISLYVQTSVLYSCQSLDCNQPLKA